MISYLDRGFCSKKQCSHSEGCNRFVSEDIIKGGTEWWGSEDFPIAISDQTTCLYWNEEDEHA